MAVPDTKENLRYFQNVAGRFAAGFLRYYGDVRGRYRRCARSPALRKPLRLFVESRQAHDDLRERSIRAVQRLLEKQRLRLSRAAGQLSALSPLEVLARGYAVVSTTRGVSVRSEAQVNEGDEVGLRFHQGAATARITTKTPAPAT
jgi:exodeoxyribonuclease VII large subunit